MIIQKLLISTFLMASLMASPGANQSQIIEGLDEILPAENMANFNFSLIQEDSVLAVRPVKTPKTHKPKRAYTVLATAYSSRPEETDHTPFITASGIHVREGVAAANFLPFGTVFKIPEVFGDKTFIVEDRMHDRYWLNIDIWFPDSELAKEFGKRMVKIEIVS